jgi:predicted TIM-barrel fold metal-dependent hydrolase
MGRLALSGVFDENPELKIIIHDMGAMIRYFEGRVGLGLDQLGRRTGNKKNLRGECAQIVATRLIRNREVKLV